MRGKVDEGGKFVTKTPRDWLPLNVFQYIGTYLCTFVGILYYKAYKIDGLSNQQLSPTGAYVTVLLNMSLL